MNNLVKICIGDDFEVDYDRERGMYRVSVFEDGHFKDEYWFDCYEEKEINDKIEMIIEKLENLKTSFRTEISVIRMNANVFDYFIDKLIDWIRGL